MQETVISTETGDFIDKPKEGEAPAPPMPLRETMDIIAAYEAVKKDLDESTDNSDSFNDPGFVQWKKDYYMVNIYIILLYYFSK